MLELKHLSSCVRCAKGKLGLIVPKTIYGERNGQIDSCCKLWVNKRGVRLANVNMILYISCHEQQPKETASAGGAGVEKFELFQIYVRSFFKLFCLSCLVCTVLCSVLLLDARFGVHFYLGSPDISYFISTDFDRNQLLWPTCNQDLLAVASI